MLTVGFLRKSKTWLRAPKYNYVFSGIFWVAKEFDIDLVLFAPEDVDLERGKVRGLSLQQGRVVERETDIPAVIDNYPFTRADRKLMEQLEARGCILLRHPLGKSKLQVYDMLYRDGRFKEFLIPTYPVENAQQVEAQVEQLGGTAIAKPTSSSRGRGVMLISRAMGPKGSKKYAVTEKGVTTTYSRKEFLDTFSQRFHAYIVQPYILSRTKAGNPFDVRVHCRRSDRGRFWVHPFPRIGRGANDVTSNISAGGFSMDIMQFLKPEFGSLSEEIYRKLLWLGREFPDYYQSFFQHTLFDVGIDLGIDMDEQGQFHLHMFEVNPYIDGYGFAIEDAIAHCRYYRFVYDTIVGRQQPGDF